MQVQVECVKMLEFVSRKLVESKSGMCAHVRVFFWGHVESASGMCETVTVIFRSGLNAQVECVSM